LQPARWKDRTTIESNRNGSFIFAQIIITIIHTQKRRFSSFTNG